MIKKRLSGHASIIRRGLMTAILILLTISIVGVNDAVLAQGTGKGDIEDRPAPVALRKCVGGVNAGDLCNEDADCPGST